MLATTDDEGGRGRMAVGSILAWACGLGVISGFLELGIFLLKCRVLDPRNLNVGRQFPWMFPAAGLIVVGGSGLALAVGSRVVPGLAKVRVVLFGLLAVASVGVLFRAPIFTLACGFVAVAIGWRGSSILAGRALGLDRAVRIGATGLLGSLGLLIVACLGREAFSARPERTAVAGSGQNVILIVLDTVRADRLGVYGYPRDTSPNLARLATRGVRFERAFSTAPWTAPSHASLFTGRWPHELTIGWDRPLDSTHPTLAETLTAAGYASAGFVANTTYCSYETGLDRGFAHYEDYDVTLRGLLLCSSLVERALNFAHRHPTLAARVGLDPGSSAGDRKDAARINRDFLRWVDSQGRAARPFLAFLNYYDAHHPYLVPDASDDPPFGSKPRTPSDFRLLKTWWERDKQGIGVADLDLARDAYDRCIAALDDQLGRLFDELARRGELDRSIVVVTSDHGEHLGERDLFGHGCSVYRPELQVPLLIVAPGNVPGGRVVDRPVSLRDVPATVLDLLGLDAGRFPGRSLAGAWRGDEDDAPRLVLSEVEGPPEDDPNRGRSPATRGPMTSAVLGDHHYIRSGDGREELFDLGRDPGDRVDLAARPEMAEVLGRFRAGLRR